MDLQKCPDCGITKTFAEFDKGARPNGTATYCKPCKYIRHVTRTYRISRDAYLALLGESEGKCQCCGDVPKRLVVDHDHETDEVRGLICDTCNHFIGILETKPSIQTRASSYLQTTKE